MHELPRARTLSRSPAAGVLLVMIAAVALASIYEPGKTSGAIAATVAVVLIVVAAFVGIEGADYLAEIVMARRVAFVVLAVMLMATAGTVNLSIGYGASVALVGGFGLWGLAMWRPFDQRRQLALLAVTLAVLAVLATVALIAIDAPKIDVLVGTEAAADALARGDNPYVVVEVPDTNPYAESGSTFEGYFYPPLPMFVYSLSEWVFGDTRWANVLAIAGFLALLIQPLKPKNTRTAVFAAGGALAFVLVPVLAIALRHGFTEPLAIALLGGAILNWRRRPFLAAVLLGLAVASKQYFILLAPVLLLWNDQERWRRVWTVGVVALGTALPFVLMDPQAFWDAAIAPALSRDLRPDSLNLIAFGFTPPPWLAVVGATTVGILLARRGGEGPEFGIAAAAVLGVAFLLGYQAFSNYWLLVFGLCVTVLVAAALGVPDSETVPRVERDPATADTQSA